MLMSLSLAPKEIPTNNSTSAIGDSANSNWQQHSFRCDVTLASALRQNFMRWQHLRSNNYSNNTHSSCKVCSHQSGWFMCNYMHFMQTPQEIDKDEQNISGKRRIRILQQHKSNCVRFNPLSVGGAQKPQRRCVIK